MKEAQRQCNGCKQEVISTRGDSDRKQHDAPATPCMECAVVQCYNELDKKEEHQISLQYLSQLVGYDSHDMEYLKEAFMAMLRCIVQYNVLGKDGSLERWARRRFCPGRHSEKKGLFIYAYSPELRRRLHNPEMYARLDLDLQKQFGSKYALALWELCTDYLGSGREYGETPFIPLERSASSWA